MDEVEYGLFDADNHYYEPRDAYTRYIDPALRDKVIHTEVDDEGHEVILVGERPFTFLRHHDFDRAGAPGSLREMLRAMKSGTAGPARAGETTEAGEHAERGAGRVPRPAAREGPERPRPQAEEREGMRPEYRDRDARLALMDTQGVETCLMFPTLGVCVEHFMREDLDQLYGNLHAFNRWLDDDWGFNHRNRIVAPPLLNLADLDRAVAELEFVLEAGARAIAIRPGPAAGRSPADPVFDPFWARVNEARVPVCLHIAESGYNEMMSVHWGEEANPASHFQSALQWSCFYGDRPIMDTIAALVLHNLFGRFPDVNVISVENGSLFVPYLMAVMDKMKGMGRNGPWIGGYVKGKPSEIVKQHVFVSPYHEEDVVALVETIGASQVVFGSDFPHPEGLAEPRSFAALVEPLGPERARMIMRDNLRGLLGFEDTATPR